MNPREWERAREIITKITTMTSIELKKRYTNNIKRQQQQTKRRKRCNFRKLLPIWFVKRNQNLDWIAFNPNKIEFISFWHPFLCLPAFSYSFVSSFLYDGGLHIICILWYFGDTPHARYKYFISYYIYLFCCAKFSPHTVFDLFYYINKQHTHTKKK